MNKKQFLLLLSLSFGCIMSCDMKLQKNEATDTDMINKMVCLNGNLEQALGIMRESSDEWLIAIKKTVERKGNPPEGFAIIKKAENLKRTSANVLGMIIKIQAELTNSIAFGVDKFENRHIISRPAQTKGIYEMMIGNKKEGKGYIIRKELDEYVAYLNRNFGGAEEESYNVVMLKDFESLTEDYRNDYVAQKKDTNPKTDFALYHFGNQPVITVLMTLTSKQIEVIKYEIKCLEKLNSLAEQLPEVKSKKTEPRITE